jgi:hypothetical protein
MTFPSVYFKHKSTDYARMPYSVDSCFRNIALHFDDNVNSLVIWRDSSESEKLTNMRIKQLKADLKKYLPKQQLEIFSMFDEQKISRHTIKMTSDKKKIDYLLTLNSVFEISKTRRQGLTNQSHVMRPRLFCFICLKNGYHMDKKSRTLRKVARRAKSKQADNAK